MSLLNRLSFRSNLDYGILYSVRGGFREAPSFHENSKSSTYCTEGLGKQALSVIIKLTSCPLVKASLPLKWIQS